MGVTAELAEFVAGLGSDDIPDDVQHQAKRALIDWVGVTLAGSAEPSVSLLIETARRIDRSDGATIIGTGVKSGLLNAALVNGFASHVLDFDDTYNPARTTVHGCAPVWPVVLALAERARTPGARALLAFVAGFESEVRVALSAGPAHYEAGWHVTGTVGHFGAAAAAARLLGLDGSRTAHALGAAGTQASGLKGVYGSMGKALHPGKAAMDGMLAALLAERGFDASTTILEAKHGFLNVLSPDPEPEAITRGLGEVWKLREDGFKPYACGSLMHPTIEAVIHLMESNELEPTDVVAIEATVNDYVSWVTAKPTPATGLEGRFSIFHAAAVACIDRKASVRQFTDERVKNADVATMRERVTISVDDTMGKDAASVTIRTANGEHIHSVPHNKGTHERPMSDEEIEAKFLNLATTRISERSAREVCALCWELDQVEDVAQIVDLCAGDSA
jgi:2-methylcitrate dehydratase PrpD